MLLFESRAIRYITVILLLLALTPSVALGAALPGKIVPCNGTDCEVCHIAQLAQNLMNTGIFIAVFLSAVLFAWAGWKYLTNAANPGQTGKAKAIFWNVTVGLIIILGAWLLVDTIMKVLVGNTGVMGPWNKIC